MRRILAGLLALSRGGLPYKSAADGDYKIVRQLPDNGGEQRG